MDDQPPNSSFVSAFKAFFSSNPNQDEDISLDDAQLELIKNIENFFSTTINEIMIPRAKMVTIESSATALEAIDLINETGHSRIPVRDKEIDKIIGVIYAKDLLKFVRTDLLTPVSEIMRQHYSVPFSQPINELLRNFKSLRVHIAIVIDEYGGVDGLVTIEDVIEQLVGKIHDEFDKSHDEPSYLVNGESISIDANFSLMDFNKLYHKNLEKEGVETIGGYICDFMGKTPEIGERCEIEELPIEIEDRNEKMLTKVKVLSLFPSKIEKV